MRFKNTALFFGFLFAFSGLGFFLYHLYKYPSDETLSKKLQSRSKSYPKDITEKMGAYFKKPESRINHFLNFPQKKQKDVIRIGVFGDSRTFGAETHKGASYPEQLEELLKARRPLLKTETLNFGVGGHGFKDQFFL